MFFRVRINAETTGPVDPGSNVPAGCFATRWVSAPDEGAAAIRAEAKLRTEIASQRIWPTFRTSVENVTRVGFVDYLMGRGKGGASWYMQLDDA